MRVTIPPSHPLALELRRLSRTAARGRRANPFLPYERVAAARRSLIEMADALDAPERTDPALLHDIRALVRDGNDSPLLNRAIPEGDLDVALRCLRFRLAVRS